MYRKLGIIIGIIVFILILSCTYAMQFSLDSNDNVNNSNSSEQGEVIYKGILPLPIENFVQVTSKYGYRNPIYNSQGVQISGGKLHAGIDLCGSLGSKVLSVKEGEVTFSGWQGGYGNCVVVQQSNGIDVTYGNISEVNVKVYDYIEKGKIIGTASNKLYMTFASEGEFLDYRTYIK